MVFKHATAIGPARPREQDISELGNGMPMPNKIRLGLLQMAMRPKASQNLEHACAMTAEAAAGGAEICCLPELFLTPYFAREPLVEPFDATDVSVRIPGEVTERLSRCAKDNRVVLVAGSVYERSGGKLFNTALVFDENGRILGKYRKTHIPHDESYYEQHYFAPGDTGFKVFRTKKAKIAVLICYDQWFPEAARCVALEGADLVFYPTAIANVKGIEQAEGKWQRAWEDVMRGHAISNNLIVAAVNRSGKEGEMRFWGGSFACDAFGGTIKRASSKEQVLLVDVDLDHSRMVREGWRFFRNRRPECYRDIVDKKDREG